MKRIALAIHNSLIALSIQYSLQKSNKFIVFNLNAEKSIAEECAQSCADILLMEASYGRGTTLEDCIHEAKNLRTLRPECRVILICDENSVPEIARQVAQVKKDGLIDEFIYSSVSESYLTAILSAF